MATPFLKMNGLGNDFVVLDARAQPIALTEATVRRLSDRRRGIGCDTVIAIETANGVADARVRFWNADGTASDACGNGTRCVAALLAGETGRAEMTLLVGERRLTAHVHGDRVTVDMGAPLLEWQEIPLAERMDTRTIDVKLGPIDAPVLSGPSAVNMGNPHCVFFVADLRAHDLSKIGPLLEFHPMFPERANIGLAQVLAPDRIRLRVWERGAGLTQACGTGACAAVVAAARRRLAARRATVELDGGALEIDWREDDGHVLMTGPVALNFRGTIDLEAAP